MSNSTNFSPFSLALDARVTWAHRVIAQVASEGVESPEVVELTERAGDLAERAGNECYPDSTIPNLIADVPYLIQRWSDGYGMEQMIEKDGKRLRLELEAMADCPGCNNGTGNPCVTHG
jgi:hypothetical protein